MLSTIADYQRISKDMNRSLKITAKKPDVSRETQYYLTHIGKVTSIDDFLKSPSQTIVSPQTLLELSVAARIAEDHPS